MCFGWVSRSIDKEEDNVEDFAVERVAPSSERGQGGVSSENSLLELYRRSVASSQPGFGFDSVATHLDDS